MHLLERLRTWHATRLADRKAIAAATAETRRAGYDPPKSISETVDDAAGTFPPQG
jgi:hypothetical protein